MGGWNTREESPSSPKNSDNDIGLNMKKSKPGPGHKTSLFVLLILGLSFSVTGMPVQQNLPGPPEDPYYQPDNIYKTVLITEGKAEFVLFNHTNDIPTKCGSLLTLDFTILNAGSQPISIAPLTLKYRFNKEGPWTLSRARRRRTRNQVAQPASKGFPNKSCSREKPRR